MGFLVVASVASVEEQKRDAEKTKKELQDFFQVLIAVRVLGLSFLDVGHQDIVKAGYRHKDDRAVFVLIFPLLDQGQQTQDYLMSYNIIL